MGAGQNITLNFSENVMTCHFENIILISSLSSMFGEKGNSLYVSSKSSLDGLVRSLSLELAPLVRINSVLPGGINTKMTSTALPKDSELFKNYPLGEGRSLDVVFFIANMCQILYKRQYMVHHDS